MRVCESCGGGDDVPSSWCVCVCVRAVVMTVMTYLPLGDGEELSAVAALIHVLFVLPPHLMCVCVCVCVRAVVMT